MENEELDERPDDAELAVLSAMLLEQSAIQSAVAAGLRACDLTGRREAKFFDAISAVDARGLPVDPHTVVEELTRRGETDLAPWKNYYGTLLDVVPTAANVLYHVEIVLDRAKRRELKATFQRAALLADTAAEPAAIARDVRAALETVEHEGGGRDGFKVIRILEGNAPEPPGMHADDLLVEADINLWAGHGGALKSTIAALTAVCTVLNRPVFGRLAIQRPGPVLIAAPEDGCAAVRMMIEAIANGFDLTGEERALLVERIVMLDDGESVNLLTDTKKLGRTARDVGAVLFIGDPLRNLVPGSDLTDNTVATQVTDSVRRHICRPYGVTALLNAHLRKPARDGSSGGASRHELLGAGGWVDGSRLVFDVKNVRGDVTMSATKANRIRADIVHELRVAIVADPATPTRWRSCTIRDRNAGAEAMALTPGLGRALTPNELTALRCLDDTHEPGIRLSYSRWMSDAKIAGTSEDTWKGIRERFLKAELAAAVPTGRAARNGGTEYAYEITAKGRTALATGWATERSWSERGEGVKDAA